MRHGISGRKLNRKSSHRSALLKNLSKSLILNEQIKTTLPKAKDLRPFVEKILTFGKKQTLHSRRKVFSLLRDNTLVTKVFDVLAKRYTKRNGGYVRVMKSGYRSGDSAPMAIIELVDRDIDAKGKVDKIRLQESENKSETNKAKEQDKSADSLTKKENAQPVPQKTGDVKMQSSSENVAKSDKKEEKPTK